MAIPASRFIRQFGYKMGLLPGFPYLQPEPPFTRPLLQKYAWVVALFIVQAALRFSKQPPILLYSSSWWERNGYSRLDLAQSFNGPRISCSSDQRDVDTIR